MFNNATKEIAMDKVRGELDRVIFLIQGKQSGKNSWIYLMAKKSNIPMLQHNITKGAVDLAQYGEILYSGWGNKPPKVVELEIKQKYG